ncbi:DUF1345 domain-containing protein [Ollibium composti]|uniref:DUF1345 domain-containing protein n=1 Tax=Ollibium composti TaxID=2675109 RepID=A0ABY2Q9Q7_9HYPH|nr:DUF1345 domain-containing protein [Mesorhizobium composti]THF58432.1 DUF1345 domain-containing protein [Mesorhizobium composti]
MSGSESTFLARHLQFVVAAVCGVAAAAVAGFFSLRLAFPAGADVAFAVYCALVLREMPKLTADYLSKRARAADLPVLLIFALTAGVVAAALLSLFQIINSKGSFHPLELAFALLSIPLGWFTIHAMTALHYAHVYWIDDNETDSSSKKKKPVGGLVFAGKERPEGWDFLYFSTTVGMTSQTSDTEVSTTQMRRIVLLHSVVSFFFNTVIVAAAVNLAVSLGS